MTTDRAVIIPCGFSKLGHNAKARDLYTGPYFKSNLTWALSVAPEQRVFILSAKHGLITLDTKLDPYNLKMGQPGSVTSAVLSAQAIQFDLVQSKLYAVGGDAYLNALYRAGLVFCAPVKGLPMGRSMAALKKNNRRLPVWSRNYP